MLEESEELLHDILVYQLLLYLDLSGNLKKRGGQPVFTEQQERVFVEHLLKLSDWLVPISRQCFQSYVQFYLKSVGKNVPRFNDNRPGKDWAYSFFKRNIVVTQRR